MSDITPNLTLPYILPSQAQKHVTHNEALQRLDAVVQLTVAGSASVPPVDPAEGECWLVTQEATGGWLGQDGRLAIRQDGVWAFIEPKAGWVAWFSTANGQRVFDGTSWISPLQDDILRRTGINTSADDVNRLAVSAEASLFTHNGADHRLKINKAAAGDTAGILLQSGWSGRAEIGLTGSDDLRMKVSGDGSQWRDALTIAATGVVRQPHRPIVKAVFADDHPSPSAGSATGFDALGLEQGGFSLGAAVPAGNGVRLVVPESGLYLVLLTITATAVAGSYAAEAVAHGVGTLPIARIGGTGSGRAIAAGLVALQSGDAIDILHDGLATFDFAAEASHLILVMMA